MKGGGGGSGGAEVERASLLYCYAPSLAIHLPLSLCWRFFGSTSGCGGGVAVLQMKKKDT